jgi:predicted DNA-binding transcriptional regulator AlpA
METGAADGLLDYKQVMALTGLGKSQIYDFFKSGELTGYKGGGRKGIRFYPSGVRAFMERRQNKRVQPKPLPRRRPPRPTGAPSMVFRHL